MDALRRRLLCGTSTLPLWPLIGSGLLTPTAVLAGEWHRAAFSAKSIGEALKAHGGTSSETRDITIQAPEVAENGGKVIVEITSQLAGTRSLAVFADKNPQPLSAILEFSEPALPYARLELKLSESTRLRVIARTADGRQHVAFRDITVTLGGCGV